MTGEPDDLGAKLDELGEGDGMTGEPDGLVEILDGLGEGDVNGFTATLFGV